MIMKKTVSTIFLLPTLKIPKEDLSSNGFLNVYSFDVDKEYQYQDCIHILFKPKDLDLFREFLAEQYEVNKNIVEDYDYPDGYVVVVYKLLEDFKEDYELVKKGKYSRTSEDFKGLFPEKITIKMNGHNSEQITLQYRVFNRSSDLVEYWETKLNSSFTEDMELWNGFDEVKETLNIKQIVEDEKLKGIS